MLHTRSLAAETPVGRVRCRPMRYFGGIVRRDLPSSRSCTASTRFRSAVSRLTPGDGDPSVEPVKDDRRGAELYRALARALYVAAALIVLLWFLFRIRVVLLLFTISLIAALVLNVPVTALERRGLPRGSATLLVFLGLGAASAGLGWLILPRLVEELPRFLSQVPQLVRDLANRMAAAFGNETEVVRQLSRIVDWLLGFVSDLWRYADDLLTSVVLGIVVTAMTLFLLLRPHPLLRGYLRMMPPHLRAPAARAFQRGAEMVSGWVVANLALGAIKAVATFLFLSWVGVPGALLWSVVAFFSALLPEIGFYLMATPPVLLALSIGPLTALWVLLFFWGLSEILGDFVAPRLWEQTMQLHPAYLLFMLLAMAFAFGVAGVLIAVPVAGFLKVFFDEFYLSRQPIDPDLDKQVEQIVSRRADGEPEPVRERWVPLMRGKSLVMREHLAGSYSTTHSGAIFMHHTEAMLSTHPKPSSLDRKALVDCIHACYDCAQTCTACADACLAEPQVQSLVRCIRLNLDCFDVCVTTGNLLSRQTEPEMALLRAQLEACREACQTCGAECERHAQHHEHCRVCAEACRQCQETCERLVSAMAA